MQLLHQLNTCNCLHVWWPGPVTVKTGSSPFIFNLFWHQLFYYLLGQCRTLCCSGNSLVLIYLIQWSSWPSAFIPPLMEVPSSWYFSFYIHANLEHSCTGCGFIAWTSMRSFSHKPPINAPNWASFSHPLTMLFWSLNCSWYRVTEPFRRIFERSTLQSEGQKMRLLCYNQFFPSWLALLTAPNLTNKLLLPRNTLLHGQHVDLQ